MISRLGKLFVWLVVVLLIGATAWWYVFFEQMLGENVKRASECFYYTTDLCSAGNTAGAVVGIIGDIPTYSPLAFWSSVAALVVGLLLIVLAPAKG